jgi:hypothetical protein
MVGVSWVGVTFRGILSSSVGLAVKKAECSNREKNRNRVTTEWETWKERAKQEDRF